MPRRTLTLIAYDIASNRKRAQALKAVRAFGVDGQKSVHECALTEAERRELKRRLKDIADPRTDRLLVMRLDPRSDVRTLAAAKPAEPPDLIYVG